jgi:hypothetical protein
MRRVFECTQSINVVGYEWLDDVQVAWFVWAQYVSKAFKMILACMCGVGKRVCVRAENIEREK